MNKLIFDGYGGSKLPPGFRFQPTDQEIVFQYLARKTFSHPLPAIVIPEINIFSYDPWELPGNSEQERYFFSNKEADSNQTSKATCSGYWKATGSAKRIICLKKMPIVGIRKSLVFYKGKPDRAFRTDWIMHEYFIVLSENTASKNSQRCLTRIGNWTLCHIFFKKTSTVTQVDDIDYDFATTDMSDTDSSSTSASSSSSSSSSSSRFNSSIFSEVSSSFANGETTSENIQCNECFSSYI